MNAQTPTLTIFAPLAGAVHSIEASADPVFAQRLVGDGVIIDPSSDTLTAPFDGTISQLHDAGHAVAIKSDAGVEILMHIGIDTVTLKGEGFESLVSLNQSVSAGQPLIRFHSGTIEQAGLSSQTAVLITSGETVEVNSWPESVSELNTPLLRLNAAAETDTPDTTEFSATGTQYARATAILKNPQGLHARPAAQLVAVAKSFNAKVNLTRTDNSASCPATSVTGIMGLQTSLDTELAIEAHGPDAEAVVAAIVAAIDAGLGENVSSAQASEDDFPEEAPLLRLSSEKPGLVSGVKAVPGLCVGQLSFRNHELPEFPTNGISVEEETLQLNYALSQARQSLESLIIRLQQSDMGHQADVFVAHLEILDDPALTEAAIAAIERGASAMHAWHQSYCAEADKLSKLDNALLQARASDIEDVGRRVLDKLLGTESNSDDLPENTILVAEDLTPSEVVSLNREKIVGLCTFAGGSTSHAAILASAMELPYIVNVSEALRTQPDGATVLMNASKATIQIDASEQEIADFRQAIIDKAAQLNTALERADQPAVTTDGVHIEVSANVGSAADAIAGRERGADSIGLVRSEFLYLNRTQEPSLAEQTEVYEAILCGIGSDKHCIIRTLDVGGDKPLTYLPLPEEENPFLGERGLRIGLNRPHLLRKQVRAILQAAHAGKPRIMFPMVTSLAEFRAAKALVLEEMELTGVKDIEIGIMIEVPAAAMMADAFAKEVDFFSIGTNDLTQYTLAIDRGHPLLAAQVDALHPAVLRLIARTAEAAKAEGKWAGICGSIASDPTAAPILIGLGITELSANVPALPLVKDAIRQLSLSECQVLAQQALQMSSAEDVRKLLR